ncbi:hypothetical protein [Mycobacterium sp. SMC-11]|uniref:DUF7572 family protein n=1 Tax=Mycobacterium sp. SMC-11 TaxID=3385969 RepID=UPI00390C604B
MSASAGVNTALGGIEISQVLGAAATVYASDSDGVVRDPVTGLATDEMAALAVFDDAVDHADALARLGYTESP